MSARICPGLGRLYGRNTAVLRICHNAQLRAKHLGSWPISGPVSRRKRMSGLAVRRSTGPSAV